ncbi:BREX-1 system adenine-specific DNA-methyltransferase PglX [Neobacillus sp. 114]|uniref:BREX-1 system adenine-specific DNA-methyltransferase PglX n=1 Tax=Neobacillus sp. 114 TaxID=3048535 RepID=UPI0024C25D24|nr:BREX-1 system adenine-specific DNA-methyltransferase PglX [Neobacillus sp. 114]
MNKKALKEFAVYARNELRNQIALRAQAFGITPKGSPVLVAGTDYVEINNKKFPLSYKKGIQKLLIEIEAKGYDPVLEEVAYTWFNRLIAIRFMEVNNYLPSKVRILSSETKGKVDPDILTEYQYTDLPVNKEEVSALLAQGKREEAFHKLLVAQCNELSEIMPFLFEKVEDFTELLLPESLLHADSLINKLGKDLEDENFEHVEVIGWLYQYYISEKKDEVFAGLKKNQKITKENIPAATQLFTPHWIVRYMVENSLGQMWLESHPESGIKKEMKYFVESAGQVPDVQAKLELLRNPNLIPEEITILDPACGSGHILIYAFDLLYKIYEERGYSSKEIPSLIIEKNLFGIDIDDRAAQLASFALLMKARGKTKRIFRNPPKLNIFSIRESNSVVIEEAAKLIGETDEEESNIKYIMNSFIDAKNYGSILRPEKLNIDKIILKVFELEKEGEQTLESFEVFDQLSLINDIFKQAKVLSSKFDIVITNPPYMNAKGMNNSLNNYTKKFYPNSKSDLFTVFMERCAYFAKSEGFIGCINQHSWMFLKSYEDLRRKVIKSFTIYNMIHLGTRAFEDIGGEVVQSTSFILRNLFLENFVAKYYRLVDFKSSSKKENAFLNKECEYKISQIDYHYISGAPISYWASNKVRNLYKKLPKLGDQYTACLGTTTGDNERFLRFWSEVDINNSTLKVSTNQFLDKKWYPCVKGGEFRKWYGNLWLLVNYKDNGKEIKSFEGSTVRNVAYNLKEGINWSAISSNNFGARYLPEGIVLINGGSAIFPEGYSETLYLLGFLSSKVATYLLEFVSQTLQYEVGHIRSIPVNLSEKNNDTIKKIVSENINISRIEWDSYEISWNYKKHPYLINNKNGVTLENRHTSWDEFLKNQFIQLQQNETELNKIFIELYELQEELTPEVLNDEVTIRLANRERDAKSFLSYCLGLMMGRYSLDVEGLSYAGGEWDASKYKTFQPDSDGIIPLTDTEYFEDDVITRLQELLVILFGQDTLAENLRWLAESLTMKANETPVERLRRYFFDEFYADHCKTYQKRPIYWLAESGNKKGFRALFYLHRYTAETLATMRFSYIQNLQEKLQQEQKRLEQDLINPDLSAAMKKRFDKQLTTIKSQQEELIDFDKKLAELANQRIALDLDDGVVVNYEQLSTVLAKIN